jgi:uncharacterized protein YndB with AHSA1/START domain
VVLYYAHRLTERREEMKLTRTAALMAGLIVVVVGIAILVVRPGDLGEWTRGEGGVDIELSVVIQRPPAEVFAVLRDKDKIPQKPGSPVLILERTTPDPIGVGTRYREVVQMMPFVRGEILSELTRFEPPEHLEEDFSGAGMRGHLAYEFLPEGGGTRLIQRETVRWQGLLRLVEPLMARMLGRQLQARLEGIRTGLDSGWSIPDQP